MTSTKLTIVAGLLLSVLASEASAQSRQRRSGHHRPTTATAGRGTRTIPVLRAGLQLERALLWRLCRRRPCQYRSLL